MYKNDSFDTNKGRNNIDGDKKDNLVIQQQHETTICDKKHQQT